MTVSRHNPTPESTSIQEGRVLYAEATVASPPASPSASRVPVALTGRAQRPAGSRFELAPGVVIGGRALVVMAGPCAVESEEQLMATAQAVAGAGATVLRGGAYKPRTSPYSFQGLMAEGLELLAEARRRFGLAIVTEALDVETLPQVAAVADVVQIGARNMQNFSLLRACGELRQPILLKRGLAATIDEWLSAAEYILLGGNDRVILCERGIRTFEPRMRNTLDLGAVALLRQLSHLPIVVDPSHATGTASLVPPLAAAAVAAGADGLLVEVHPDPAHALSDGPQSLTLPMFAEMTAGLRQVAGAVGRAV
jgi:3-deoxy-7-phosphoheptulonate synthase